MPSLVPSFQLLYALTSQSSLNIVIQAVLHTLISSLSPFWSPFHQPFLGDAESSNPQITRSFGGPGPS